MSGRSLPMREFGLWTTESGACTLPTTVARLDGGWANLPSRGSPGTLNVFEADHESLSTTAGLDAHAMDPAAVFASLVALGGAPPPTVVIGCEVASVEENLGLSQAVAAAVPRAANAINDAVACLLARESVREG